MSTCARLTVGAKGKMDDNFYITSPKIKRDSEMNHGAPAPRRARIGKQDQARALGNALWAFVIECRYTLKTHKFKNSSLFDIAYALTAPWQHLSVCMCVCVCVCVCVCMCVCVFHACVCVCVFVHKHMYLYAVFVLYVHT